MAAIVASSTHWHTCGSHKATAGRSTYGLRGGTHMTWRASPQDTPGRAHSAHGRMLGKGIRRRNWHPIQAPVQERSLRSGMDGAQTDAQADEAHKVAVFFALEGVHTLASPNENLLEVAYSAGVDIPSSCLTGSCGTCEVEVCGWNENGGSSGEKKVVRACISNIPTGARSLIVDEIEDDIWGEP